MITSPTLPDTAVYASLERFAASWNIHDASSFAAVFAEDADFTNVFGQKAHGRTAIEQSHAALFKTMFRESHLRLQDISVRMLQEDLAAVDVVWTISGARDRHDNPWHDRKGLISLVMSRQNGSWLILVMHNMELPATSLN